MRMRIVLFAFLMLLALPGAPLDAQMPPTTLYAVSYVDVNQSRRDAMVAALRQYRDAIAKENGFVSVETLEQIGRPGHFAVVEAWRDQQALDAHASAASAKQLRTALQPIRLSGYDERFYKALTAYPAPRHDPEAVYVLTHVDVIPSPQADAPGLLTRLADASRREKGMFRFDVVQHTQRANHFTIIETWQNPATLDAHAEAAHTKQYRDALQPLAGGPLDERLYRSVQ
jgi:quinol monooxygenase YgiN